MPTQKVPKAVKQFLDYANERMEANGPSALPDPDGQNSDRVGWAIAAMANFSLATRTDPEDVLKDLLCDLMHYCDATGEDFEDALETARDNHEAETAGDDERPVVAVIDGEPFVRV